jgi:hypothetical protein
VPLPRLPVRPDASGELVVEGPAAVEVSARLTDLVRVGRRGRALKFLDLECSALSRRRVQESSSKVRCGVRKRSKMKRIPVYTDRRIMEYVLNSLGACLYIETTST